MGINDIGPLYCMFKGEPGLRKFTSALSFPKPMYVFNWDHKENAMYIPLLKWKQPFNQVTSQNYSDWNGARAKLEQLAINCPYKTIVIKTLTSMADYTLGQTRKLKQGTSRKSGQLAGKLIAGIQVNEIEDYNAESAALHELIALTKDIKEFHKINIILIAHVVQAEYRNTTTNETHVSRTIITAGKRVGPKIPGYCDEVYHFNLEKGAASFDVDNESGGGGQYALLTQHTGDDFARTTLPLDKKIIFGDEPLYDKWILPAIKKLKADVMAAQQSQQASQPPSQPASFNAPPSTINITDVGTK